MAQRMAHQKICIGGMTGAKGPQPALRERLQPHGLAAHPQAARHLPHHLPHRRLRPRGAEPQARHQARHQAAVRIEIFMYVVMVVMMPLGVVAVLVM